VEQLRFCYEAGPPGYALCWQLTRMGAKCEVVAPTLVLHFERELHLTRRTEVAGREAGALNHAEGG
jgi:hypothetical protein